MVFRVNLEAIYKKFIQYQRYSIPEQQLPSVRRLASLLLFSCFWSVMFPPCLFLCLLLCYISVFCHFGTFICLSSSLFLLFISISRGVGGGGGHLRHHQMQNKQAQPDLPSASPYCCKKGLLWDEKNSGAAVDYESAGSASENI